MKKITFIFIFVSITYCLKAQNTCLTAIPISAGSYTVSAINGSEIPFPICAENGTGATAGEWYVFTAIVNGVAMLLQICLQILEVTPEYTFIQGLAEV